MASLTLNPNREGALEVDEKLQTPEFQFGSDSNSIEINKKLPAAKDGAPVKIDLIPDGSQSCGSTLQGRKLLNLSIGTQFN